MRSKIMFVCLVVVFRRRGLNKKLTHDACLKEVNSSFLNVDPIFEVLWGLRILSSASGALINLYEVRG
jgi:hypothetical protein